MLAKFIYMIFFIQFFQISSCNKQVPSTNFLEKLKSRKVLRVATTSDYRPFSYYNAQGELVGIDIELAHLLGKKLGFKIRDAELQKIPFVLVVGQKEKEAGKASLRLRKIGDQGQLELDQIIGQMLQACAIPQFGEELASLLNK